MKIPKIISKNNHEYIFVKKCNDRLYLYKEMLNGYNETFTDFDLGLVKEVIPKANWSKTDKKYYKV